MLSNTELAQLQYEARKRNAQIKYVQCCSKSGEARPAVARYMSPATARTANRRLRDKGSPWLWVAGSADNTMIEPTESVEHVERLLALASKVRKPATDWGSIAYAQPRIYNAWLYSVRD